MSRLLCTNYRRNFLLISFLTRKLLRYTALYPKKCRNHHFKSMHYVRNLKFSQIFFHSKFPVFSFNLPLPPLHHCTSYLLVDRSNKKTLTSLRRRGVTGPSPPLAAVAVFLPRHPSPLRHARPRRRVICLPLRRRAKVCGERANYHRPRTVLLLRAHFSMPLARPLYFSFFACVHIM